MAVLRLATGWAARIREYRCPPELREELRAYRGPTRFLVVYQGHPWLIVLSGIAASCAIDTLVTMLLPSSEPVHGARPLLLVWVLLSCAFALAGILTKTRMCRAVCFGHMIAVPPGRGRVATRHPVGDLRNVRRTWIAIWLDFNEDSYGISRWAATNIRWAGWSV
jgi:hypothetical protein